MRTQLDLDLVREVLTFEHKPGCRATSSLRLDYNPISVDAKYKGHVEKGQLRLSEADIYEALAFAKATGCNLVALAYPAQPGDASAACGHLYGL